MPQCMGQFWRLAEFLLQAGFWSKTLSISLQLKGQWRLQSWSGRQASRDLPAIGHIRVTPFGSPPPSSPCWAQEQGNPEHRPPRSHSLSHIFANQRITVTWQVSERHCQRVGSSFRRRKTNRTFYILHYMWLCTICWYPDDGVHVWNIWYLAFSRRHEIKCITHRVTSVFATVATNPHCCSILTPKIGFMYIFLKKHGFKFFQPVDQPTHVSAKILSGQTQHHHQQLCYWFSSYSLRAIKWR